MILHYKIIFGFLIPNILMLHDNEFCDKNVQNCNKPNIRYMFYDVNPPEGFNLRRDVFMRFAIFAQTLVKLPNPNLNTFQLVLPPWSNLYHWKHTELPEYLPWSLFFDVESLQKFAPVIEMHQYFSSLKLSATVKQVYTEVVLFVDLERTYGYAKIQEVYVLQHFEDMFSSGKFEERMNIAPCIKPPATNFFYYPNVTSNSIQCLSFHGHASQLAKILDKSYAKTVYFDHGEVALHDRFGDAAYWRCRRSMRFSDDLVAIASDFRRRFLKSSDVADRTERPPDWRDETLRRSAIGGPYMAVHLRRRDFVWGRAHQVPSVEGAAAQIRAALAERDLAVVFIATDAPVAEFDALRAHLVDAATSPLSVLRFKPNKAIRQRYRDGGVAIVEQILCAHASYFIGTHESTFSFRIQEEREILGFPEETTFNRLCGDEEVAPCSRTTVWKIQY